MSGVYLTSNGRVFPVSAKYSLPRTSGIYLIRCTANNKIYIGSTSNLRKRQHDHFADMARNAHSNKHMQSAWNKYGSDTFTFEVLEYVMPWSRIDREQYWLDKLKPYDHSIGFNVAIRAQGDKLSPEHRASISRSNMGHPVSEEVREKLRKFRTGRKATPQERVFLIEIATGHRMPQTSRDKESQRRSTQLWKVVSPNGDEFLIYNLKKFCRDNSLHSGHMFQVAKGNKKHYRGWKCEKVNSDV